MKRKSLILTLICILALLVGIVSAVMAGKGRQQTDGETQTASASAEMALEGESEEDAGKAAVPSPAAGSKSTEANKTATSTESGTKSAKSSPSPGQGTLAQQSGSGQEAVSSQMLQDSVSSLVTKDWVSSPSPQETVVFPAKETAVPTNLPTVPTPTPTPAEPEPLHPEPVEPEPVNPNPLPDPVVPDSPDPDPTEPEPDPTVPEEPIDPYVPATMEKHTGQGLGYWLYTPENPSAHMPLIVYLHGGSGKGDDLDQLLGIDGFPKWLYDGSLGAPAAYVLIPQLSSSQKGWSDAGSSVIALIHEITAEYNIDAGNISLTGHSMGGTGTFALAKAYPDTFTRIAPCSGSIRITNEELTLFQNMDVWAFVGTADTIVAPQSSIYFVDQLSRVGHATLTQFEGATHFYVPALAYLNSEFSLVQWLIGG